MNVFGCRAGLVVLAVSILLYGAATGQPPGDDAASTDQQPVSARGELKEQTIYIPYTRLKEIFETEGRGVFLPYEKFRELWKAAYERTPGVEDLRPPVGALIAETDNEATVQRDVVRVKARVKIETLTAGWHKVPLHLADAAVLSASLDDKPARVVAAAGGGYELLIEAADEQPRRFELLLEYAKTYTKAPGRNSVSLSAPRAPVSRWQVRVDEPGVKIDIHPLLAATDVPPEAAGEKHSAILAFVGAAEQVQISWTPRAEGATGLAALATVQAWQQVFVDDSAVRTRAELTYAISRAELERLVVEVPSGQRVVNVFDANVRRWSVEPAAEGTDMQRVAVELFEPARQQQQLVIELEQLASADARSVAVAMVRAVDVGRQYGTVVVRLAEGLRGEVARRSGLLQIDVGELPRALAGGQWDFAYRYYSVPFELSIDVEKVQPRVQLDALVDIRLEPEQLALDARLLYDIQRAGVFRLELAMGEGFEVRQVRGLAGDGVEPAHVDSFRTIAAEGDAPPRLVVQLSRKALGRVGLLVQLARRLQEPALLVPSEQAATLSVALPRSALGLGEQMSGRVVVFAPESLRVNPGATEGLRPVSFSEARQEVPGAWITAAEGVRPVLAFRHGDEAARLELVAQRRKPLVTVAQALLVRVEPGVVKYEAQFHCDVLYSGVKSLRIDVPSDVAPRLRNDTPGIRETVVAPPPDDLAEGWVAWSLAGEAELLGKFVIRLAWEQPLERLEVGAAAAIDIPRLAPHGADRAWGQVIVARHEAIDIDQADDGVSGLRPIDPQTELISGVSMPEAARAYEFHDAWSLRISATRYQLEEVKRTSVERGLLRIVVTRGGQHAVQALYRLRSVRQRLAVQLPAGVMFDTEPLRINGRSVALERGKADEYFVPLAGQDAERPLLLELRYTLDSRGTRFDPPVFPEDPAVQKVYLAAYLPEEWAVRDARGPWSAELRWRFSDGQWRYHGGAGFVPLPVRSDRDLVNWVSAGIDLPASPYDAFQVDGQIYLFSTLRPEAPPAGALELPTVHRGALAGLVWLLAGLGGVLLLRCSAGVRWIVAGAAVVALLAVAVFRPLLAMELVNGVLVLAALAVLVLWSVAYLSYGRPRRPTAALGAEPGKPAVAETAAPASGQPPEGGGSEGPPPQADAPPQGGDHD